MIRSARPRLVLVALVLVAALGCKKKGPEPAVSDTQATTSDAGFVQIDMSDEDAAMADLAGSELMQATAKCGDLRALEPSAMMGKLKDGEVRCLEDSLKGAEKQTVKDKISRVLMADSWAKGDADRWEALVRRHLNEIDRSDADLCYKFSKYLADKGPAYSDETMHWAEVALENRTQWTGDTYVSRVNALYKLRAYSAQEKWQSLEKKYVQAPDDQLLADKDQARNEAKTLAREWLEYTKQSGKDSTMALQLCVSAAGTEGFCEGAAE